MARRRKRRRLKAGGILWLLAIGSVVVGLFASPLTAARNIAVSGAANQDRGWIARELQWLKGKPCLAVNGPSVAEQIMRDPCIESAELSRNLLGNAHLTVTYYQPVARVQGLDGVVLTDAGFLCRMPWASAQLPVLELFPGAVAPNLGISASWEPEAVAEVCRRAAAQGIVKNLSIAVTPNGSVCLNSGGTGRVSLGSPDELDAKFEQIGRILKDHPEWMEQQKDLVLIAPKRPVTRPLQSEAQ